MGIASRQELSRLLLALGEMESLQGRIPEAAAFHQDEVQRLFHTRLGHLLQDSPASLRRNLIEDLGREKNSGGIPG